MAPEIQACREDFMDIVEAPVGRREKRKQEIRARIEDAAYRLFKQQGVEETSIEQICVEADVARRTFYGHFANKHALLGGLGISRLYNRSEPMLRELMANHSTTRARLEAMIDYIEATFAGYEDIDRQLILMAPSAFINNQEQKREINNSAVASFTQLIAAGVELGDVKTDFSPDMLATLVVGTFEVLTTSWAMDSSYPIFAKLEEARTLFEHLICKDNP
jgi:AcrR family transcriptional regulator